jgi:hypothetical protein
MPRFQTSAIALVFFSTLAATQAWSANSPAGMHDPEALTCDAPELVLASKAAGHPVCMQNDLLAQTPSITSWPVADLPTGEGSPDAVSCRAPQQATGTRFLGPEVCARNAFWAKLQDAGCIISPGGRAILRSATTKKLNSLACHQIPGRYGVLPVTFF